MFDIKGVHDLAVLGPLPYQAQTIGGGACAETYKLCFLILSRGLVGAFVIVWKALWAKVDCIAVQRFCVDTGYFRHL